MAKRDDLVRLQNILKLVVTQEKVGTFLENDPVLKKEWEASWLEVAEAAATRRELTMIIEHTTEDSEAHKLALVRMPQVPP